MRSAEMSLRMDAMKESASLADLEIAAEGLEACLALGPGITEGQELTGVGHRPRSWAASEAAASSSASSADGDEE